MSWNTQPRIDSNFFCYFLIFRKKNSSLYAETKAAALLCRSKIFGSSSPLAATVKKRSMHISISAFAFGEVGDHIIYRQEGTHWCNVCEAGGHRTGVNISTNTASRNDWLPLWSCCEKSILDSDGLFPSTTCWSTGTTPLGVQNLQLLKCNKCFGLVVNSLLCVGNTMYLSCH